MSEFDPDRADLEASRKALAAAQVAREKAEASLAALRRTSSGIRVLTDRNGYVDRFREMIRGG